MREQLITFLNKEELKDLMREVLDESQSKSKFTEKIDQESKLHLITTSEIMKRFGVSRTTVYLWRKKGLLPYRRLGKRIYFLENEVIKAVKKIDFSELSSFPYKDSSK